MKFRLLTTLLVLLAAIFSGCQPPFQPGDYIDDLGRAVTIEEVPQRIVSFGPNITEILFALGLGEKVVGVSDYCDYPEAAQTKPKIGNAFAPSLERVVELEPDLVLTLRHEQLNAGLETLGLTFFVLDPENIEDVLENIELAGEITGTTKQARGLVETMEATIAGVRSRVADAPAVSVFYIIDATDPNSPWTAGPGSFIDSLIDMAGGENIAAGASGMWVMFSLEQLVSADPDLIIIQTMVGGVPTVSREALEAHPVWQNLTAVQQGKIYFVDGDLVSRPGPRIVQGLEVLVNIIHPE